MRPIRQAAAVVLTAIVLAGCAAPASAPERDGVRVVPSQPGAVACYTPVDYPVPPVHELLNSLPVPGLSMEHALSDYQLVATGRPCTQVTAGVAEPACEPMRGSDERLTGRLLWRSLDDLTGQLFGEGVTRFTTADLTGMSQDGHVIFRYRMTAVRYPTADRAAAASPVKIVERCEAGAQPNPDFAGARRHTLSHGDQPYLVVQQDGAALIMVEGRISADIFDPGASASTRTGLLPAAAMNQMVAWYSRVTA
ncbi:hypothetical protein [Dactylosporangium sp. NPDC050588]|uniref:hypothetical protein n=1 Tax=Dactylosporangium sp. NPDC050588 TaxID=3157211 RepID=UPI0033D70E0B